MHIMEFEVTVKLKARHRDMPGWGQDVVEEEQRKVLAYYEAQIAKAVLAHVEPAENAPLLAVEVRLV